VGGGAAEAGGGELLDSAAEAAGFDGASVAGGAEDAAEAVQSQGHGFGAFAVGKVRTSSRAVSVPGRSPRRARAAARSTAADTAPEPQRRGSGRAAKMSSASAAADSARTPSPGGDVSGAGAHRVPGTVEGEFAAGAVEELVVLDMVELVSGGGEFGDDLVAGTDEGERAGVGKTSALSAGRRDRRSAGCGSGGCCAGRGQVTGVK